MSLIIIVPCYNEYKRIPVSSYLHFLEHSTDCSLLFLNDGSTDKTGEILNKIRSFAAEKVFIHTLKKNSGKSNAVREAALYCFTHLPQYDKIAYLDADLSASPEECVMLSEVIGDPVIFAFGSRISKIDNNIQRKLYRHIIGRFFATIFSSMLGIKVYDTQCGCKVFTYTLAKEVFREKFISKWLFDVEIFYRIIQLYGKDKMQTIAVEQPLKSWIHKGGSKIDFTSLPGIWYDFFLIYKRYHA